MLKILKKKKKNLEIYWLNLIFPHSNRWNQRNRPLAPLAAADVNPNFCFGNQKCRQAGDTLIVEFFFKIKKKIRHASALWVMALSAVF